jgi:hypothetical protein
MIYEFYTGRELFAMADGTPIGELDARARCLAHAYATDLVDDPRWKLLVDGLVTWDMDRRWGGDQVAAWLRGESPPVHDKPAPAVANRTLGYRPSWSPALVATPEELAQQFRDHWDEAASELAGRPDAGMIRFLKGLPGMEAAVRAAESNESPGSKLVRLQAILDPGNPIIYEGVPLNDASIAQGIQTGDRGDQRALSWLAAIVEEHILTAYAEVTGSHQAAQADYLLDRWKEQATTVTGSLPPDYQELARWAFRTALPGLFVAALRQGGGAS